MLIALLAVLGVDLIVIVIVAGIMLSRRAWVKHQPGTFMGAVRVADGKVPGLGPKWKRGGGRWVGDVLVWEKAPFLFRNELVEADRTVGEAREATPDDKVKRLGSKPVIASVAADKAHIEIATAAAHRDQVLGLPGEKPSSSTTASGRKSAPAGRPEPSPVTDDASHPGTSPTEPGTPANSHHPGAPEAPQAERNGNDGTDTGADQH